MSVAMPEDSHDAVLRFNCAPTDKFEKFVGNRTDFRMINTLIPSRSCQSEFRSENTLPGSRLQQFEDSAACSVDKLYKNHAKKNLTDFDVITKLRCPCGLIP
ncbi:beta-galactoside alpha-2,6-sialyltransferase [Branchiostoma belcheri]|nr:beta-galactoside alpha-2,6-sialyltransferase [Branchiostoma belcheri]